MSVSFGYGVNSFQSTNMSLGANGGEYHTRSNSNISTQLLHPHGDSVTSAPPTHNTHNTDYIYAIDNASTKLKIPFSAIEATQALDDDGLVPGLCRLYMDGRCRQSQRCFQVHANPMVVEQLREEARRKPSCCHFHGAPCSYEGFPLGLTVTVESRDRDKGNRGAVGDGSDDWMENKPADASTADPNKSIVLSLHYLCPTSYLWKQYKQSGSMHLTVPINKVCREHNKGLCRFGDECSFLHGCRQALSAFDELAIPSGRTQSTGAQDHGGNSAPYNNYPADRWSRGQSFDGQTQYTPSTVQMNSFHPIMNFEESAGSSLGSRHLATSAQILGLDEKKEQLLKPLAVRNPGHCSTTSHPSTSFSHNPYGQISL